LQVDVQGLDGGNEVRLLDLLVEVLETNEVLECIDILDVQSLYYSLNYCWI
jgi:hypothetical protein